MISVSGMVLVATVPATVVPAALSAPAIAGGTDAAGSEGGDTATGSSAPAIPPSTLPDVAPVAPTVAPVGMGPAERDGSGVREARDARPLKLVAVTWKGQAPDTVELRSTDAGGRFGAWTALDTAGAERDDPPARAADAGSGGTEPIWVGDRTAVEVRATRAGASVTDETTVVRIDPGTSSNDAAIGRVGRAATAPAYVTRAQWGAGSSSWRPEVLPAIRAVTIHHTAESNDYGPGDSAAIVRGILAYHTKTQGWGDIGYNALVDKFGTIFEGRAGGMDKAVVAAHAGGFNRETWGIAMMGNFVSVTPTAAQRESAARLAAWKLAGRDPYARISLTSSGGGTSKYPKGRVAQVPTLFGHRDVGNTECPGNAGYATLNSMRDRIKVLSTGTTAPSATPTNPATASPKATKPPTQIYGGEPVIREGPTVGNRGWYNLYSRGAVYWTPTTGSWEVFGDIYSYWAGKKWESSPQGYPTSNEYDIPGGRQQNFEKGHLRWTASNRQVTFLP